MALETIAPVPWKSDFTEVVRYRRRLRAAVDNERFAEIPARMNSVDKPFVVHVLRRHRPFGGFAFIRIGVICIVAHDAELGVVALLAMQLQLEVTGIAILRLHWLASRYRFPIRNRKILDHIVTGISLSFFDGRAIGPFHFE